MSFRYLIALCLAGVLYAGCDGADVSNEWVSPEVRVSIVDAETGTELSKSLALLRVELQVRSQGGRDYSPEPVTVDNAVARQVAFDVSIPPDSLYAFAVRFTNNGTLIGEGATIQEVTLETSVINIAVLQRSATVPSVAFFPSEVAASIGGGTIDIDVRLYGAGEGAAGVAAIMNITGPRPRPFVLQSPDDDLKINFVDGNRLNAAWQFAQDVEGVKTIGTLRIPRNIVTDYCLEAAEDNVRVVSRNGNITSAMLLGACVTITQ